jgi:hypothetical protein
VHLTEINKIRLQDSNDTKKISPLPLTIHYLPRDQPVRKRFLDVGSAHVSGSQAWSLPLYGTATQSSINLQAVVWKGAELLKQIE